MPGSGSKDALPSSVTVSPSKALAGLTVATAVGGLLTTTSVTLMSVVAAVAATPQTVSLKCRVAPPAPTLGAVKVGFSAVGLDRVTASPVGVLPRYCQA